MPYKSEKLKLTKEQDRRIKITDDMREAIKEAYKQEKSYRAVGRLFNLDKKTIKHVIYPQLRLEEYQENKLQKHWAKYYDKKKHREYIKNHRRYKQELYKAGLLE